MNVVHHYFVIGLVLLIVCANHKCKANTVVECPNLPITPYPPIQTTNPMLPAYPGSVQPITIPCQNQPVYPGSVQTTIPCQTICNQNLSNQVIYGQNGCQYYPCPTTPQVCCQTQTGFPCQPTTTIPPPTTLPPTTTLPPSSLIMCPPGTILIGQDCHLVYCPPGSVMRNERCMSIECPKGTVWTGHRCSVPEPIVQDFTYNNTITTYINRTTPDVIIKSTKNIVVNLPVTINEENHNNVEDYNEESAEETTTATVQKCCMVMTPRICQKRNNRWHCYSRRSHRCGDFCIAPIIYLKPPRIYARPNYVVLPPIQNDCDLYGTCGTLTGGHDCSGCAMNHMSRCSYYCYRYACPLQKCQFFDHQKYCSNNVPEDMFGCQEMDGCYDDWCLNN